MDFETSIFLRCHIADDFANSDGWDELIDRLSGKGFHLTFVGNRLILVNERTGVHLCTCSYLGFGFASLTRNWGKPHVHARSKALVQSAQVHQGNDRVV